MLNSRSFLHPFPARMAPDLALNEIGRFNQGSVIADPMVGSGTVAISAVVAGHEFHGFDLDPLAALVSRVSTSNFDHQQVRKLADEVIKGARSDPKEPEDLPWIFAGDETDKYISFWFAAAQCSALASISYQLTALGRSRPTAEIEALKVALSRIIVTKESKASLARDTSHSRPHRVKVENDYDVFKGFDQSVNQLLQRHEKLDLKGVAHISTGDARQMISLKDGSCDAIVSSPPYLNAIDYLRGHKLSLVWLGYSVPQIRNLRSNSVGCERGLKGDDAKILEIMSAFGDLSDLPLNRQNMIYRYAVDLRSITKEASRILKINGTAFYVMGNSCLKGVYIDNASALVKAAECSGLRLTKRTEREIPQASRYLPTPKDNNSLSNRMRKEVVLSLCK